MGTHAAALTPAPRPVWVSVYRDARGEWRWRARTGNGKIVAESGEGYVRRSYCERAAARLASFAWVMKGRQ